MERSRATRREKRRERGKREREKLRVSPSDRRIHYPGLLVILERRLRSRATALDALEEYKTRGSWVPRTTLFLSLSLSLPTLSPAPLRPRSASLLLLPPSLPYPKSLSIYPPLRSRRPRCLRRCCLLTPVPRDGSESFWGFRYIYYAGTSIKEGSMYSKRSPDRVVSARFDAAREDGHKIAGSAASLRC